MDSIIISSIIGAVAAVIVALIALVAQPDFIERFRGGSYDKIVGIYDSIWIYPENPQVPFKETLTINKQSGKNISGYMLVPEDPKRRWDFKGIFNGKYLEFYYFPSRGKSEDKLFEGFGCYFLVKQSDGSFRGFSTGIDERDNSIGTADHSIKRITSVV